MRREPRLGWGLSICLLPLGMVPTAAAQSFAHNRAIPHFPRPAGSADPALRVQLVRGDEAAPLRIRTGTTSWQYENLYRRMPDGSYRAITAPGYRSLDLPCPSQPVGPGDVRTRMIDLAAAEWAYFGLPVLDLSASDATAVPRDARPPDPFDIIDPPRNFATGRRVVRRALRLGLMEDDAEVRATIAGYWVAAGGGDALRVQSLVNFASHDAGWAMPWSAAFVSWLACESGLAQSAFRRGASHFDYVRAAIRARDGQDATYAYLAYDLGEALPEPGDLLCTARGDARFASIADVRASNGPTTMHCDLVVRTAPAQRRLYGIGGNIAHAVTLSVIATDAQGHPLPDRDLVGANRWFALLKLRDPGHAGHDLDGTPTVLSLFQGYRRYAADTGSPPPAPLKDSNAAAPPPTPPPAPETHGDAPK